MADDNPDAPDDETTPDATAEVDDDGATDAGAAPDAAGDEPVTEEDKRAAGFAAMRAVNRSQIGQLTLHYPARDVVSTIDGDAALRILSMFARSRADVADVIDHRYSYAGYGWLAIDLRSLMAISWEPGIGIDAARTIVDPVPAGT